ncbi:MAG: hypothetical protein J5I98_16565 [Phaeodactylibacter sp.]|nr:hypothetical protein [Phaeodactylibacter sp.]
MNFHVHFKPGHLIAPSSFFNYRIPLAEYKARFEISSIAIYMAKPHPFLYGVSDRYMLFAFASQALEMDSQEISVGFFQNYKRGALYPVILPNLPVDRLAIHEPLVATEAQVTCHLYPFGRQTLERCCGWVKKGNPCFPHVSPKRKRSYGYSP